VRSCFITLGFAILGLLGIGLMEIASASAPECIKDGVSTLYYVKKQSIAMGLGLIAAGFLVFFDYHNWRDWRALSWVAYGAIVILLIAVLFTDGSHGSKRWVELGRFQFQPSEVAKFLGVILVAVAIDKIGWKLKLFWKGLFPILAGIGLVAALIFKEPDYGAGVIFLGLTGLMLWIGGAKLRHLLVIGLIAVAAIAIMVGSDDNRVRRINESLQKDSYGYQVNNSIVAIREGGYTGRGHGNSLQKWQYLPEAHTDYIFAIGAEEGGMVFTIIVATLYALLLGVGMRIAYHADRLGKMIAYGMTFLLTAQAVANMAVVSGWGFSKGLAMPFLSYGGSNVIVACMAVGMIFSVGLRIELPRARIRGKINKSIFYKGGR
jgi:cell division protein FtsW